MSAKWRPFCLGLNVLTFGNIPNITSHERHDISCYSKLFGDKTLSSYKKTSMFYITLLLKGESASDRLIPLTKGQ